jgi:hypothetical protein
MSQSGPKSHWRCNDCATASRCVGGVPKSASRHVVDARSLSTAVVALTQMLYESLRVTRFGSDVSPHSCASDAVSVRLRNVAREPPSILSARGYAQPRPDAARKEALAGRPCRSSDDFSI